MDPVDARADARAGALVAQIGHELARQRAQIDARADADVAEITGRAHDKALRQRRRARDELRAQARLRLRQVHAELDTARRQRDAARARAALDAAWPLLAPALARRWADTATRDAWIAALVVLAAQRLRAGSWQVRHPPGDDVAAAVRAALARHGRGDATLHADAALGAGIAIEADGAWLDGSAAALLADREGVEAVLLAQLDTNGARGG